MFMFRKKEVVVSTSTGLQKEAKKFQEAVAEINAKYKPESLNYDFLKNIADKYGVEVEFIAGSFEAYLKRNAITEITKMKKSSDDFTVWDLEKIAEKYGYTLETLGVTYYSVD